MTIVWIIAIIYILCPVKTKDTNKYDAIIVSVFILSKVLMFCACVYGELLQRGLL
ncbi:MAG: hypothetical protein LBF97_06020 [Elusimicrobiota bacterium]|jgi:predicted membrane channel-forming protein YqfA (hemolysin III family)|nr:hypothetical protein [Elusimicrobiota bacterium]